VDVERDLLVGILRLQEQQLGDDEVGDLVVDRSADEDDALLQQPGVDVEGPLATARVLDDHRDEVTGWTVETVHVGHKEHSRHGLSWFSQDPVLSSRYSQAGRGHAAGAAARRYTDSRGCYS